MLVFQPALQTQGRRPVPDDLLAIADAALYRAKHSGKNKIVLGDQ